jgi:poly(3-hydroxybutyrate) depolymerase
MLPLLLSLGLGGLAAPRTPRGTNVTSKPGSSPSAIQPGTCPSLFGPGKHSIDLRVADPNGGVWERNIQVFVPDALPLDEERPSVLNIHGCGSDPEKFEEESELDDRAARFGFYSVYMRGSSRNIDPVAEQQECNSDAPGVSCGWNAGANPGGCQTPVTPHAPDDVYFAGFVLDWMSENLCVDMDRIFAVGFSNVSRAALLLSHWFCGRW